MVICHIGVWDATWPGTGRDDRRAVGPVRGDRAARAQAYAAGAPPRARAGSYEARSWWESTTLPGPDVGRRIEAALLFRGCRASLRVGRGDMVARTATTSPRARRTARQGYASHGECWSWRWAPACRVRAVARRGIAPVLVLDTSSPNWTPPPERSPSWSLGQPGLVPAPSRPTCHPRWRAPIQESRKERYAVRCVNGGAEILRMISRRGAERAGDRRRHLTGRHRRGGRSGRGSAGGRRVAAPRVSPWGRSWRDAGWMRRHGGGAERSRRGTAVPGRHGGGERAGAGAGGARGAGGATPAAVVAWTHCAARWRRRIAGRDVDGRAGPRASANSILRQDPRWWSCGRRWLRRGDDRPRRSGGRVGLQGAQGAAVG